MRNYGTSPEKS